MKTCTICYRYVIGISILLHSSRCINSFTTFISHHGGSNQSFRRFFALNSESSSTSTGGSRSTSRTPSRSNRRRERSSSNSSVRGVGPKGERSSSPRQRTRNSREINNRSTTIEDITFDPKKLTSVQIPNENADPLDLFSDSSSLQMRLAGNMERKNHDDDMPNKDTTSRYTTKGKPILHAHFQYMALDDLFPNLNFSETFFTNGKFREDIRQAMRSDIFYTTPAYSNLSPKVAAYMLDDDSSLQGSWNCIPKKLGNDEEVPIRMSRLTSVLKNTLGDKAPTGDEFMMTIGKLCGINPSNHWIDIIGVKDRIVSHSWHQDTGRSYENDSFEKSFNVDKKKYLDNSRYTVMLGFPKEDKYEGTGVFSHSIKLCYEHLAPDGHNENEPVLFEGLIDDKYVIRPSFSEGRELLIYRDVDTLHSAPDIVYRRSVMRFM